MTSRADAGGASTVALGSDESKWTTEGGELGVGSPEAHELIRQAPGGTTSIDFANDHGSVDSSPSLPRAPPGGSTSVTLGEDSAAWTTHSSTHGVGSAAALASAEAHVRQAPGGDASIDLSPEVRSINAEERTHTRAAPGGAAAVVLGSDRSNWVTNSSTHGVGSVEAVAAAEARVRPAPGGEASISFSASSDTLGVEALLARPSPGGTATVLLGGDAAQWTTDSSAHGEGSLEAVASAKAPVRGCGDPCNPTSINFGNDHGGAPVQASPSRPAPGGAATVLLGGDVAQWTTDSSAHGQGSLEAIVLAETPARDGPWNTTSINFGSDHGGAPVEPSPSRPAPGGAAKVVLGGDSSDWTTHSSSHGVGSVEAIASAESRARPAPGGQATLDFGNDHGGAVKTPAKAVRGAPGGMDSIDFGMQAEKGMPAEELLARPSPGGSITYTFGEREESPPAETLLARPSPGGTAKLLLGGDTTAWTTNSSVHGVGSVEAISAAEVQARPAPGGLASVDFGNDHGGVQTSPEARPRAAPGGTATVLLGADSSEWATNAGIFGTGSAAAVATAEARERPAPGGAATVNFGNDHGGAPVEPSVSRAAPGGAAKVVLGADSSEWMTNSSALGVGSIEAIAATPVKERPAPGGVASIDFVNDHGAPIAEASSSRPAPGGATKILLGAEVSEWVTTSSGHNVISTAPEEARARPAPGGDATIILGGSRSELELLAEEATVQVRAAPGGASTLVLGGNFPCDLVGEAQAKTSSNHFATGSNPNAGNFITDRSSTHVHHAPGGASTLVLGGNYPGDAGGEDQAKTSSNSFANGSNQNAGNCITERPSTRVHHAPGGATSLVLGNGLLEGVGEHAEAEKTSSNCFANGSNQNAGNCITDRSSTRIHHAPGGASSLTLGKADGETETQTSSNKFANGSNQNAGNYITDRSSTRVHHAPGGASSVTFGDPTTSTLKVNLDPAPTDENVDASNIIMHSVQMQKPAVEAVQKPAAGAGEPPRLHLGTTC